MPPQSLPGASQMPPQSLPGASQMPPESLPGTSQMPPESLPGTSQMPPESLPGTSHQPPRASQEPPTSLPELPGSLPPASQSFPELPRSLPPASQSFPGASQEPPGHLKCAKTGCFIPFCLLRRSWAKSPGLPCLARKEVPAQGGPGCLPWDGAGCAHGMPPWYTPWAIHPAIHHASWVHRAACPVHCPVPRCCSRR